MPKVNRDAQLLENVAKIVENLGGYSAAARVLGVNRTTLWRFATKGCAINRTRVQIAEAIAARKGETYHAAKDAVRQMPELTSIPLDELRRMRALCANMVALIDMFETTTANSRDTQASERLSAVSDTTFSFRAK